MATSAVVVSACGHAEAPKSTPTIVRIEIHGALANPIKSDGTAWDGTGAVSHQVLRDQVASFLGSPGPGIDPMAWTKLAMAGTAIIGTAAALHLEKPDLKGFVSLDRGDGNGWEPEVPVSGGNAISDSFAAAWTPPLSLEHVTLTDRMLVRVRVVDDDLTADDPVETVQLRIQEIQVALAETGAVLQVPVFKQGNHQLWFVSIAVVRE